MKTGYHVCLLAAGTLLTLTPVIYKTIAMITAAVVAAKGSQANIELPGVDHYLGFSMYVGVGMILLSVVLNWRSRNAKP